MGFIDRLGNLAKGGVKVQQQAWEEGGGLEGRLEQLKSGAQDLRESAGDALRKATQAGAPAADTAASAAAEGRQGGAVPGPAAAADPVGAPAQADLLAAELDRLELAFADGKMTRTELRRKQAEARAQLGGSARRML